MVFKIPDGRQGFKCPSCGDLFTLSYRYAYQMRKEGKTPYCKFCKSPITPVVTDELREWWASQFDEYDIVFMAEALWGPRELWQLEPADSTANLPDISQPGGPPE